LQGIDQLSEALKEEIWPNPMAVLTAAEAAAEEDELGEGEEVIEVDDDEELQEGEEDEGEEEFEEVREGVFWKGGVFGGPEDLDTESAVDDDERLWGGG
jgi:hypothetical protein